MSENNKFICGMTRSATEACKNNWEQIAGRDSLAGTCRPVAIISPEKITELERIIRDVESSQPQ